VKESDERWRGFCPKSVQAISESQGTLEVWGDISWAEIDRLLPHVKVNCLKWPGDVASCCGSMEV
jgi:hypothetical protein